MYTQHIYTHMTFIRYLSYRDRLVEDNDLRDRSLGESDSPSDQPFQEKILEFEMVK